MSEKTVFPGFAEATVVPQPKTEMDKQHNVLGTLLMGVRAGVRRPV